MRRVLAIGALVALAGCGTPEGSIPTCPPDATDALVLVAQSVPSATQIPCVTELPVGWSYGGQVIERGRTELWLYSDRAGEQAVTVTLTPRCAFSDAVEVPSDESALTRYEEPISLTPVLSVNRYYVFEGGCVTYRFRFQEGGSYTEVLQATEALSFVSRAEGAEALREAGLILCGAGVDCPG
ncbi:MAG TPA: hypothetical protein VF097_04830 [Actinomycetota bacterium]